MVKQRGTLRLAHSGDKVLLISKRKDGNLGKSEVTDNISSALPHYCADDAIELYDGKYLLVVKGNLTITK